MKKVTLLIPFFLILLLNPAFSYDLAARLDQGLTELNSHKGDPDLCVLTDAPYVTPEGSSGVKYVSLIQEHTGCSAARGNLLFFHHPVTHPLTIALYRRDTADCVLLTLQNGTVTTVKENISKARAADGDGWKKIQKKFGRDSFGIVTILTAWGDGAPGDFLKCAELHNHLCPGVTSGYLMARFILDNYPPTQDRSLSYIASPVWCKEDALQVMLDLTPGKRNMATQQLTKQQRAALKSDKTAGIIILKDKSSAHAYILGFDWSKAPMKKGPGIKQNPLSWNDAPETYVSVLFDKEISLGEVKKMTSAGTNPYEVLGFVNQ